MNSEKRIAYIFEEAKIFLTKDGNYYAFEELEGHVKCRKLTADEKKEFVKGFQSPQEAVSEEAECVWQPIARSNDKNGQILIFQQMRGCSGRQIA